MSAGARRTATAIALTLALMTAGCGGDKEPEEPVKPAVPDGITEQGTVLGFDEPATIPADDGVVTVRLVGVVKGKAGLIPGREETPWFVTLDTTIEKGGIDPLFLTQYLTGFYGDDKKAGPLVLPLTVGECQKEFWNVTDGPGTQVTTCLTLGLESDQGALKRIELGEGLSPHVIWDLDASD